MAMTQSKINFDDIKASVKNREEKEKPVGRFAPSPTGYMHLGNVWAALIAWLAVRKASGTMILRIEDLDPQRSKQHFIDQLLEDMKWLGLDWDEGPDVGGAYAPYLQNFRRDIYESALNFLKETGHVYPCFCTRKELRAASAPHIEDGVFIYNGKCKSISADQAKTKILTERHAWRIKVPNRIISFDDLNYGKIEQNIYEDCGDFVLARTDGVHAYQLAVVVDDALMGVDMVVRGADLLDSSPRQIFLHESLGFEPPTFGHVPLLLGEQANRLSKRHNALGLNELRKAGWRPEDVIGLLGWKAGLLEKREALKAIELIDLFEWKKIPQKDVVLYDQDIHSAGL